MRVYKVLDTSFGGLTSLGVDGRHMLRYTPGELMKHPNMFVFESEDAAWSAKGIHGDLVVWECETSSAKPAPSVILEAAFVNRLFIDYWGGDPWSDNPDWPETVFRHVHVPPECTVLVDDLKLIREVRQ